MLGFYYNHHQDVESNNNETATGGSIRYDSDDVDSGNIRRNFWLRNLEKKGKKGN